MQVEKHIHFLFTCIRPNYITERLSLHYLMFSLYEDNWHSGMYVVFALAPSSGLEIAMVKYLQHNFVFLLLHVLINVTQGVLSHAYVLVSHE